MSEVEKAQDAIIEKTKEVKEIAKEVEQEKDPVVKKGLVQRLEQLEEDLQELKIKWKGFQNETMREEKEKEERKKKHEKEVEEAKMRKGIFDD